MNRVIARWVLTLLTTSVVVAAELPAHAQEAAANPEQRARSLFTEGVELADAGNWEDAADRFRRARNLVSAPNILLNLAGADREIGRFVEASEALAELLRREDVSPEVREEARRLAASLDGRAAHVTVTVEPNVGPLRVSLDGRRLPRSSLGTRMRVDPGEHVLDLRRGDVTVEQRRLRLAEGADEAVTFEVARIATPEEAAQTILDEGEGAIPMTGYDDTTVIVGALVGAGVEVIVIAIVIAVLVASGGSSAPCGNADPCRLVVP